jgi:hypothetical protein
MYLARLLVNRYPEPREPCTVNLNQHGAGGYESDPDETDLDDSDSECRPALDLAPIPAALAAAPPGYGRTRSSVSAQSANLPVTCDAEGPFWKC